MDVVHVHVLQHRISLCHSKPPLLPTSAVAHPVWERASGRILLREWRIQFLHSDVATPPDRAKIDRRRGPCGRSWPDSALLLILSSPLLLPSNSEHSHQPLQEHLEHHHQSTSTQCLRDLPRHCDHSASFTSRPRHHGGGTKGSSSVSIYGYRVLLMDLYLASTAYSIVRTLRLCRDRQWGENEGRVGLHSLPCEVFTIVVRMVIADVVKEDAVSWPGLPDCTCPYDEALFSEEDTQKGIRGLC